MLKRLIVILLIIGWISLSGFDLIEDLNEISGQVTVSVSSPDDSPTAKRGGSGPLANNIVESAGSTQRVDVAAGVSLRLLLSSSRSTIFDDTFHCTNSTASF